MLGTRTTACPAAGEEVHAFDLRVTFAKNGAGNGIRTRDFDLGKVALYH